ncbi:LuxR C-terminal-related transcriptional regulator [Streptomyces sp. BE147]|uniref:helix-turn-helix transcriptional regulator n=1 Tax=Streptomyces sp. BE147 TaxID=3002524 RepID=UPI002E7A653C|nr:LuxR C-terminal-related transcriptional regulator [Streptomyces sp. BE147]MEE1740281.1 LuxR C-terminal-related transcriptional regulator [Streptomyces sp. BE147]
MGVSSEMAKDYGRHISADTYVLDAPGTLTADLPGIQELDHRAAPRPRGGTSPYIPGEAGVGPGHRVLSADTCPVVRTMELANLGTSRVTVIERTERVLDEAESRADARCMWRAILTLLYAGDVVSANAQCERLAQDPLWAGSSRHHDLLTLLQARSSLLLGDARWASDLLGSVLTHTMPGSLELLAASWLVEALVDLGEYERAHKVLLEHELAGRLDEALPDRVHILAARGALHTATGRFAQAIDDFTACGRILSAFHVVNPAVIPWRSKAAFGALAARRFDLALALAENELIAARKWGSPRSVGTALHAVAVARRDETSVPLLDEAVALLCLGGARTELVRALYDLSVLRVEHKDLTSARRHLEAASVVARECRNTFWSDRVTTALERLSAARDIRGLTRQEVKIAQLARAGYSNRRIAETLFLTVRTVEFHLSNVYRKLSISGRRELVAALSTDMS